MNVQRLPTMPRLANTPILSNVTNAGRNVVRNVAAGSEAAVSAFSGVWIYAVIVLGLMILFAVYYDTIGYYMKVGWDKLQWSRKHGETVDIRIPDGPTAQLTPAGQQQATATPGLLKRLEKDVETALEGSSRDAEVFNVSRNIYKFEDAEPLCRAFGAELASYDQVKEAYEEGADWCNYGWVKGQLAVYPTQKSSYEQLQKGPEALRMSCGLPGVNGGYFPNADQRFGVNCYGARPPKSQLDARTQTEIRADTVFDKRVNEFKSQLGGIAVSPWSKKSWSDD